MKTPQIINGGLSVDDRGSVKFINDFNFENVKRFYQVQNHRSGFIRAWHGHVNEGKFVFVPKGSIMISVVNLDAMIELRDVQKSIPVDKIFTTVLSSEKPAILQIPNGFANGFKTLEENTIVQFFSTSKLEDSLNDDIRFEFDLLDVWQERFR